MGGLKAGDVYVHVGISLADFEKNMSRAMAGVEKFAKQVEAVGNKLGALGKALTATIGVALVAAGKANEKLAAELQRVKDLFFTLGAELGEMFAPALKMVSELMNSLVATLQSMDPALKATIGSWTAKTAAVLLAAGALGKIAGAIGAVAGALKVLTASGFLAAFYAALPAILATTAAVSALALAAGAVYNAWIDGSTGFKDAVYGMVDTLKGWAASVAEFFTNIFRSIGDFIKSTVSSVLNSVAAQVRTIAQLIAPLTDLLGLDTSKLQGLSGDQLTKSLESAFDVAISGMKTALDTVADAAVDVGKGVAYGLSSSFDGAKKLFGGMLPNFGGGGGAAKIRSPIKEDDGKFRDQVFKNADAMMSVGWAAWENFTDSWTKTTEEAQESVAIIGKRFAESWKEEAAAQEKAAKELADSIKNAKDRVVNRLKGAFGAVSDLADVFMDGAAAGGPLAGIGAVFADLLTHSKPFATLIEMVSNFLQTLADTIGAVLLPILPIIGSIFDMLAVVLRALTPVIASLLAPLTAIAPIFQILATLLQGLAPVIALVAQVIAGPLLLVFKALEPALKGLFYILKTVGAGLLWVVSSVSKIWNALVGAVKSVFDALAKIPLVGKYLKKVSNALGSLIVPTDELDAAQRALKDATWDSAEAAAAESVARWSNTEAMKEFGEELSNIPTGFKLERLRLNAQDSSTAASLSQGGGSSVINNITINAPNATAADVAQEVIQIQETTAVRNTGTKTPAKPRGSARAGWYD